MPCAVGSGTTGAAISDSIIEGNALWERVQDPLQGVPPSYTTSKKEKKK